MNSPLPDMSAHWQESLNWQPDSMQQATFGLLYDDMLRVNRQFNLTRITEPLEFWEKHLWDSLSGMPIAIIHPTWQITLLDSTRKKITFIQEMIETLGLSNALGLVDRVEQLGHNPQHREFYDLATIRAVASAPVCAEYALPMLKIGGHAVLYRGQWSDEEDQTLKTAAELLGSEVTHINHFTTPLSQSTRTCITLTKRQTIDPAFPRAIGLAVQKPLS
jgi:16S rRNA (guanine527-N7)-methyltransferase